ncbi:hypothetical protein COW46_05550 [Candidatus Gracilibacteria bacterium CG17_big_fil_post_rev_8_21_14_2_50_48_13]|nr:MAG: hypothetical protein COW46_05550 [Candidatus Gracilibacteria bacterium CG17_big_fil_post_rev_8_21_14_2_50_48_13]
MELIYLLQILQRHIIKVLLISLLAGAGAFGYVKYLMPVEYKNTIVFSTTTKVDPTRLIDANYDPLSYFESADRFAEAIIGWFRNPSVFTDLRDRVPAAKDLPLDSMIKVRKQEKQNLNILFTASSKSLVEDLGTALQNYLKERVAKVNEASNSSYDLVDFQSTIEESKTSSVLAAGVAFTAVFILLCLLVILIDLLRGVVLFPHQAEQILGNTSLGKLSHIHDLRALAALLAKEGGTALIVDTHAPKEASALAIAKEASSLLAQKTVLIEGNAGSTGLLEASGVGSRLGKVKGFFDNLSAEELVKVAMQLHPEDPLLRFIGSGQGRIPSTTHIQALSDAHDVAILSASLPESPYVYLLEGVLMVVVVKVGVTKLATLRHIAQVSTTDRVLIFAS